MKIFHEFMKNYKATYLLKRRYYNITSIVGLLSVAAGMAIMLALVFYVGPLFGFDSDTRLDGSGVESFAIFIGMIALFIVCLYLGVLIVAGSFAFVMYKMGYFSKSEALNYALYSGYAAYWFDGQP